MKVLLLNPPNKVKISKDSRWPEYTKSGTLYYPFWLAYATAVLMEDKRHKPLLLDAIAKEMGFDETIDIAKKFGPDLLVVDTSTPTIYKDVEFVEALKKEIPDVKVMLTGRHVTALPSESLKMSPAVDMVARQEFDYTVLDVANTLENGGHLKDVTGISFKENGEVIHNSPRPLEQNLDKIPFVSKAYKEFLDVKDYRYALAKYPMIQIWSSRGCPAHCNYCIDGNSLLILKVQNKIKTLAIKDFIDKIVETRGISINNHDFADISDLNLQVWSDNQFVKLNKISRTKKDKILEIKCNKGYYIKVSEDHTIPVRRNGEIIDVKAKNMMIGDEIIISRPNILTNSINEINLFKELIENVPSELLTDIYIHNLDLYFKYLDEKNVFNEIKKHLKPYWLNKKLLPINLFSELVKTHGITQEILEKLEIGGKNLLPVPLILKLTKEFMQIIGFFVAEGNYNQYNLVITKSDQRTIDIITNVIKKVFPQTYLSITPPTEERGGQITFGGKLVYLLFKHVLKIPEGASNKQLPDIVFNVSEELVGACLSGAFTGDGLIDGRKIAYTSTSEVLANQVHTLLLALGMNPSLKLGKMENKKSNYLGRDITTKRNVFYSYIGSWDDRQRFVEKIGFLDSRQNILKEFQIAHKPFRIKLLERLERPKTVAELSQELCVSQSMIRHMALTLNHEGFVFREKINVGNTRKLMLSLKKSSLLRESMKEFVKINRIEELDQESFLYDMETENNYFSANNILVHNCDYPQVFTMHTFRMRSPKNVVDEMQWIHENLPNVKEIFLEDDTFTINRQRVLDICEEIKKRGLKLTWSCNARANLDYELLKAMHDAGARILIVGYESGNQNVLNKIHKGIVLNQALKFTRAAQKAGLKIFGCFMIGLSGDTEESVWETFQWARKLNPDMVFFQQAVPFPGTEFYAWAKANGYLVTEDYREWLDEKGRLRCLVNYPWLPSERIDWLRETLMVKYYFNPKHIFYTFMRNLHPHEFIRVVRYARDYFTYLMTKKFFGGSAKVETSPIHDIKGQFL